MNRRESLKLVALTPMAAGFTWTQEEVVQAQEKVRGVAAQPYAPDFFTAHEYETIHLLVDLILPADDRSGSATDAGVPAFIDFMMIDQPARQVAMRGGLAWLDHQCRKRYDQVFKDCEEARQRAILDDIAWPEVAAPDMSPGVAFFNSLRDLTASGFWSSRMGVDDLQYMGNTFVQEWTGCPSDVLDAIGVRYED